MRIEKYTYVLHPPSELGFASGCYTPQTYVKLRSVWGFTTRPHPLHSGRSIQSTIIIFESSFLNPFGCALQLQLPSAMTCNPLTTPIQGMPEYLTVATINATQPGGPKDTLPACAATDSYTQAAAAAVAAVSPATVQPSGAFSGGGSPDVSLNLRWLLK